MLALAMIILTPVGLCSAMHTSSLFDCFALEALKLDPTSLGAESSFGRGMFEGLSLLKLGGARPFGVPLKVPVCDMLISVAE